MNVISALLVRNESHRWLREFLDQQHFLSDRLVVVDDASTDDTAAICREYTDEVHATAVSMFSVDERLQRSRLWDLATRGAKRGDWILAFDADELLPDDELGTLKMFLNYEPLHGVDALSFQLLDMWSPTHYRDDQFWTAHQRQWVRAVRFDPTRSYQWRDVALHCGSFPMNAASAVASTGLRIKHLGWSRQEDRLTKYERYMQADPNGEFGWLEQYHSILDPAPNLVAA